MSNMLANRPISDKQIASRASFSRTRFVKRDTTMSGRGLLTRDEEARLCRIVQGEEPGDEDAALQELLNRNQGLINKMAGKWYDPIFFPFDDAVSECTVGFITACRKFDASRGNKLSTMATNWMTQALMRSRDHNNHLIHIPVHALEEARLFNKRVDELSVTLQRDPTEEDIEEHLHLSPDKVRRIKDMPTFLMSIDCPAQDSELGSDTLMIDFIAEPVPSLDAEMFCTDFDLRSVAAGVMSLLQSERQQDVLKRRMGLHPYDGDPQTLQEIGNALGLTRERVRQIESQAIKSIRVALGLPAVIEKEERSQPSNVKGPRPRNFTELAERNDAILKAVEGGATEWEVSSRFGISESRARQCCTEARKRKGGSSGPI